jgi:HD-GYP domain-containing protein (c-di-GMP phosphodiesterase class II)
MKLVAVNEKLIGDVLATPIYTERGLMFLNKGNKINDMAITRLKKMRINTIYIEDGNDEISLQEVLPTPIKIQCIQSLVEIFNETQAKQYVNDKKIIQIVKNIINDINLSENAVLISNIVPNSELSKLAMHCIDVTILTIIIGIKKKFNDSKLMNLGIASLLHDIGKLFSDNHEHVKIGYELVKKNTVFAATTYMAIYYLYEREDGSGPFGVCGEKLHEFIKILSICNEYIKIISGEKRILPHEAIEEITAMAITKFDKEIFKDFIESIYCYPNGLNVKLNNDLLGIVVMQNEGVTTRPIIGVYKNDSYCFCNLLDKSNLTLFIKEVVL